MSNYVTNDIEYMIKQANILRRLASGAKGAFGGGGRGMLIGGALGLGAAPLAGLGLAGALGVGGAGAAGMGMLGAGAGATVGGLRGLFKRIPRAAKAVAHTAAHDPALAVRAGSVLPAAAIGGGIGYMSSDNKTMGTMIGIAGGLAARPMLMKALAKRAGRGVA